MDDRGENSTQLCPYTLPSTDWPEKPELPTTCAGFDWSLSQSTINNVFKRKIPAESLRDTKSKQVKKIGR